MVKQDVMKYLIDFDSVDAVETASANPKKHVIYSELGVDLGFVA